MKRNLIPFLSIILVSIFLCLCIIYAKQDSTSAYPFSGKKEGLPAIMPPITQISETPDIFNSFNTQAEDNTQDDSILEYTIRTSPVALTFYSEKRSTNTGKDTVLYTNTCVYPVVAIEENKNAASKINADIQARVDSFHADTSLLEYAEYEYENYYDPDDFHSYAYTDELLFTAVRADSGVISFLVTTQFYAGGAHGMDTYIGLNYDTQTGELIDFAELAENANAFYQDTLSFHQNLAAASAYKSIMWPDEETWNESNGLDEVLYQDDQWYFSTSGLVFFSNPYELGAYYAGRIEFTVPYAALKGMGLKEQYDYEGTKTIRLQTEEVFSFDLNGDGPEEEIQFFIDKPGSTNTDLHFIINGTDYASAHEELSRQFSDDDYIFCWTECFLYDMDDRDDTTEIAFQMNYSSQEEDRVIPYTFLYRYEKDGTFSYLGKIEGRVTDPTVVFRKED